MATDTVTTVTFLMVYAKHTGLLHIKSVKAYNIPMDISRAWGNRKGVFIRFKIKEWNCKTQVKTLYRPLQELIWNESFSHKIKPKHMKQLQLQALVEDDTGCNIGEATLNLDDMQLEDTTVYTLPIVSHSDGNCSNGHLHFSVHPLKSTANIEILKAHNLTGGCNEYKVQARLQSSEDYEKQTTWQESHSWNEEITLEGNDLLDDTLILQVVGKQTEEEQILGEVRLPLREVKQNEYGRFLPLQELKEDLINFLTNFNSENETMVFCVHGLESLRYASSRQRTNVYVQIKQILDGQILKKEKTPRFPLSENVFFPKSSFSFTIPIEQRNSTTFTVSIKTQKYFFSLKKLVIGRTVIGPFSDGKWYKDFLREKNTDLEHSLHLQK